MLICVKSLGKATCNHSQMQQMFMPLDNVNKVMTEVILILKHHGKVLTVPSNITIDTLHLRCVPAVMVLHGHAHQTYLCLCILRRKMSIERPFSYISQGFNVLYGYILYMHSHS